MNTTPYLRHRDALWTVSRFADVPMWRVYRGLFGGPGNGVKYGRVCRACAPDRVLFSKRTWGPGVCDQCKRTDTMVTLDD